MCGIIAAAGHVDLTPAVTALTHRGPDATAVIQEDGITLGHTRLAIQDPTPRSDQPYRDGPVCLVYNGELFNTPRVRALVETADPSRTWHTTGDTEVVAAALAVLGPQAALPELDGMYALAWTDTRRPGTLMVARDRHGEVPLHVHRATPLLAASELKAFRALGRRCGKAAVDVPPGQWWELHPTGRITRHTYHQLTARPAPHLTRDTATRELRRALAQAVDRRIIADVPVCALLSGGLDSAAIVAELTRHHPDLTCYTAVLDPKPPDLRHARTTADALGVTLIEVPITPPTADDLTRAVETIEQPYKAQVEIAWPCLTLAAAMRSDGFRASVTRRPKVAFQDGLGLKTAITRTLPDPARYYRAEHTRLYG